MNQLLNHYPNNEELRDNYKFDCVLIEDSEIKAYKRVYKIGVPMPYLKVESKKHLII